ncbi:MAG: polyprenyl synthetase family protein [Chloroflexi bacterium]|nr:polyprenyl synthetase family protein [Chloroflexota bacterium]
MAQGVMVLLAILEPVQEELALVEAKLRGVTVGAYAPLAAALQALLDSGGKRLRPTLAILSARFYPSANLEAVVAAAAALEMLHTATLVHDDLIDGALLRRGNATLNASWNQGSTVLAGDYIFAQAAAFAAETENPRVISLFAQTLMAICDGELRQIFGHLDWEQPEEEYYRRIFSKTASLFAASAESGAVLSGAPEMAVQSLRDYGRYLGMAFQVVDDVLDFTGDEEVMGKPVGSDLRQGTLTLPVFYFLQNHPERREALRALIEGADGDDGLAQAVEMIRFSSAIEAARGEARGFIAQAKEALRSLPAVEPRQTLHELADFVVERHL